MLLREGANLTIHENGGFSGLGGSTPQQLPEVIWFINLLLFESGSVLVAHMRHQSKTRRGFKWPISY